MSNSREHPRALVWGQSAADSITDVQASRSHRETAVTVELEVEATLLLLETVPNTERGRNVLALLPSVPAAKHRPKPAHKGNCVS